MIIGTPAGSELHWNSKLKDSRHSLIRTSISTDVFDP